MTVLEFRLLGDFEVRLDDRVLDTGHARQRGVLAVLLVEANRGVSIDRLVDRVWAQRPPQRARGTVHAYISRLRRALSPSAAVITRRSGGYCLAVDPLAVDLHRFRHLTAQARSARADPDAAVAFAEALQLWRGEAFTGLDVPWLDTVREGLDSERLAAEADHADVALRQGLHAQVLPGLTARAARHLLDERIAAQLITALYRCGRQADALAHYEQLRLRLAEELGADPSPAIQNLHRQVLTSDIAVAAVPAQPVPRQLPVPPRAFIGRSRELAEISAGMRAASSRNAVVISAIGGAGGIGKTWLALRWAHENIGEFPDGQLYVDLQGFDPRREPVVPATAVRAFLDALGVQPASIPLGVHAQAALYRSLVADKRMLIILDNVRDTTQLEPLLPGSTTCTVLVTSRQQLAGLVTAYGARPLGLDVLSEAEASQLLTDHLGVDRMSGEPGAIPVLLEHCAGLPLALGIIAARVALHPDLPLATIADELREASTRLDALDAGEVAVNLRAVLSCSDRALAPDAAHMFTLLGHAPGSDISLPAAASLAALPPARARVLLRQLASAHLVQEYAPGRYRMHDLVRVHAADQARELDDDCGNTALNRLLDHYLHTAYAAERLLQPTQDGLAVAPALPGVIPEVLADHAAALSWFTREHPVLVAAVERSSDAGFHTHAWQLAWTLKTYLDRGNHVHELASVQQTALDAARRSADQHVQAHIHRRVGRALALLGRYDDAHAEYTRSLQLFDALGDRAGQADVYRTLAWTAGRQGDHREALDHGQRSLELERTTTDPAGRAYTLNIIGVNHARLGEYQQALIHAQQALVILQDAGDKYGQAHTWHRMGYAHHRLTQYAQAVSCYERAIDLNRDTGNHHKQAQILTQLGETHLAATNHDAARTAWRSAIAILHSLTGQSTAQLTAKLHALPDNPTHRDTGRSGGRPQ